MFKPRNICCEKCPWYTYDDGDINCLLVSERNKVYSEDEDCDEIGCNFHIKRLQYMARRFKERLETFTKECGISGEEFERHTYTLKQKRKGGYIVIHDGLDTGCESNTYKQLMKGGHRHRRNYCICSQCGKWFRKNKGIHEEGFDFCDSICRDNAEASCDVDRDVGGCYDPNYEERK